ncbi:ABC transporter permease [Demequina sp. SYSU T00039]|uniref:Molybdenum transport system permease n=1 Tax=Demequina lignilytica TaxID=3051663 RepID=A0AAW7LZV4_9MICO|nr:MULTISPECIES: ABC transporter permease [unclassified Demequina]MDN4478439.1 ABC transporter permease [Demequina sp. SYSU T00039-1]MDN4487054.1 ABC transporter permease [Demequina sp. SYSU T00039]
MTGPRWLAPLAVLGGLLVLLPLVGLASRVPWEDFWSLVASDASLTALGLSLRTAAVATALVVALGVPLGFALHRLRGPVRGLVRAVVLAPLVLPPVVGGLALLYAFGRRGLLGEQLGGAIAFSTVAVVIAQTFVAMPFMVVSVESALDARSGRHEAMAATLGASRTRTLLAVTLPALGPALATGAVLAFARALGEFGATLTFAGSLAGVTRTAPLEIYLARETDPAAAAALSLVLVAVAIAVVALAYRPLRGSR